MYLSGIFIVFDIGQFISVNDAIERKRYCFRYYHDT